MNKRYGTTILLTEATRAVAGPVIATRPIDWVVLPGQQTSTMIYELVDAAGHLTPQQEALCDGFQPGVQTYQERQWTAAQLHFERCLKIMSGDTPSLLYLERLANLRSQAQEHNGAIARH